MAQRKKIRKKPVADLHINDAKIEMLSNREIIIDGCKGIVEYDENLIKLSAYDLVIGISGENILIDSFDGGVAIIRGIIGEISFTS